MLDTIDAFLYLTQVPVSQWLRPVSRRHTEETALGRFLHLSKT